MDERIWKMKIKIQDVAKESGVAYQVISNHRRDGRWSLDQFLRVARAMKATDEDLLEMLREKEVGG